MIRVLVKDMEGQCNHDQRGSVEVGVRVFSDEAFKTVVGMLRGLGAQFDPKAKTWIMHGMLRAFYDKLNSMEDASFTTIVPYSLIYDAVPIGNYYVLSARDVENLDSAYVSYTLQRFDPKLGEWVEETVNLVKTEGDFAKLPRGLVSKAAATLWYMPFAPWLKANKIPVPDGFRDYQAAVFKSMLNDLAESGASTMMIPTGGGKTYMAPAILKTLMDTCPKLVKKAYYLTTSLDLVHQFVRFAEKWGIDVGEVSGEGKEWDAPVVAATAQTLYSAIKRTLGGGDNGSVDDVDEEVRQYLDEVDDVDAARLVEDYKSANLVFIDEAHHIPARTIKLVAKTNPWALRIAASATPWRNDGRDLEIYGVAGFITAKSVKSSDLIKAGYLVPVEIIMWRRPSKCSSDVEDELRDCVDECIDDGGDEDECWGRCRMRLGARAFNTEKRCVFNDEERNRDIVEVAKNAPKPFLILTKEVKPAKRLFELAREAGLNVELVYGAVKGERRSEIYAMFPKLDGIVADGVANEGLDLPDMRTLIITGGGKSKVLTIQRVGRAVRKAPGKEKAYVVDIWDTSQYFSDHAEERLSLYRTEPEWRIHIVDRLEQVLKLLTPSPP